MATDKKAVKLRLGDSHRAMLDGLASDLRLSNNAVIEQAIELLTTSHKGGATLGKVSDSKVLGRFNSGATGATIKGIDAQLVLLTAKTIYVESGNDDRVSVLWHDGGLWLVGASSNGSQKLLKRIVDYPEALFDLVAKEYQAYSLDELKAAVDRWNELRAIDGIESYSPYRNKEGCFYSASDFLDQQKYRCLKLEATEAIAEARAVVEVVNDAMVVEANEEPSTPLNEAMNVAIESDRDEVVTLTGAEFRDRLGFVDLVLGTTTYSKVCKAGKSADGWLSPSGDRWFMTGQGKNAVWTRNPITSQVAESKVLSIV